MIVSKNRSKKNVPSISIVIATFNSARTISLCMKSIKSQNYPKSKIEIIVSDGGSSDDTIDTVKKFGARVYDVDNNKQNAEYNKGVGLTHSKGEIVLFLDHDNILPHKNWLRNIVNPLKVEKEIVGSEPLRFHYDKKMTLLDRYFALIGGSDPVVYYLGKNSHLSWAFKDYNLLGNAIDKGKYYEVVFSPDNTPALGGNGAAFRRKMLLKYTKCDPDNFIHTDIVADLIRKNFNHYAIIKDSIMHLTNNRTLPFLKRRIYFIEKYQINELKKRRYKVYDPKTDKLKLFKYIFFSLTFVVPFFDSVRGYTHIHDRAWFLHPFMCIAYLIMYSFPVIKGGLVNGLLEK